jgi:hypothetical protein
MSIIKCLPPLRLSLLILISILSFLIYFHNTIFVSNADDYQLLSMKELGKINGVTGGSHPLCTGYSCSGCWNYHPSLGDKGWDKYVTTHDSTYTIGERKKVCDHYWSCTISNFCAVCDFVYQESAKWCPNY